MKANEILEMRDRLDAIEKRVDDIEKMFKVQMAINDSQTDINTYTRNCLTSQAKMNTYTKNCLVSIRETMEIIINGPILTEKEEK